MLINCRGNLLDLRSPVVMGILNITPDSFYKNSRLTNADAVLRQAEQMLKDGAKILDIGGVSTRPGADNISVEEELYRVIPAIELIVNSFPEAIISIDTYQSQVAQKAIEAGIHLVNDISASSIDENLLDIVAKYKLPYILMHLQGTPQNMQIAPQYEDVVTEVMDFFIKKLKILNQKGIQDVVLDVGFGFGKTIAHNYQLLANLHTYKILNLPVLVGVSRKSMIWKPLEITPTEALNGTSVLHTIALQQGANILRVHDVKEAIETIKLLELVKGETNGFC